MIPAGFCVGEDATLYGLISGHVVMPEGLKMRIRLNKEWFVACNNVVTIAKSTTKVVMTLLRMMKMMSRRAPMNLLDDLQAEYIIDAKWRKMMLAALPSERIQPQLLKKVQSAVRDQLALRCVSSVMLPRKSSSPRSTSQSRPSRS
jgi:hypothetical protein